MSEPGALVILRPYLPDLVSIQQFFDPPVHFFDLFVFAPRYAFPYVFQQSAGIGDFLLSVRFL